MFRRPAARKRPPVTDGTGRPHRPACASSSSG